ncbi:MAG: hypothetical protein AAF737_05490 [Pseudomonadota bacterium]
MTNRPHQETPTLSDLHNLNRKARQERSAAFYAMLQSVGEWFGHSDERPTVKRR